MQQIAIYACQPSVGVAVKNYIDHVHLMIIHKLKKKKNLPFKSLPRKSTFSKVTIFNTNKLYSSDSKDQLFSLV